MAAVGLMREVLCGSNDIFKLRLADPDALYRHISFRSLSELYGRSFKRKWEGKNWDN